MSPLVGNLASLSAVTALALWFGGFRLEHGRLEVEFLLNMAAVLAVAAVYGRLRAPRLVPAVKGALVLVVVWGAGAFLQYVVAAFDRPLIDPLLAACDRALGIDWPRLWHWAYGNTIPFAVLSRAYLSLLPQTFIAVLAVGMVRPERLSEFLIANALTLGICIGVSAVIPALGAGAYFGIESNLYVDQLVAVRSGSRIIDLDAVQGLVVFPSYHAALAVLCMRLVAALPLPLAVPFWAVQAAIVAATPPMGGHHVVDVLAGIVLAVACVVVSCRMAGRRKTDRDDPA
jgi:PAP2 superfamily